jgi:hypothetical protein
MPQEAATDTPRDPYSYIEFEFRTIICFARIVITSSEFRTRGYLIFCVQKIRYPLSHVRRILPPPEVAESAGAQIVLPPLQLDQRSRFFMTETYRMSSAFADLSLSRQLITVWNNIGSGLVPLLSHLNLKHKPPHSQTCCLLTSSFSLGVPVFHCTDTHI